MSSRVKACTAAAKQQQQQQQKPVMFLFRSVPSRWCRTVHASRSIHMHVQLAITSVVFQSVKMESLLVRSPTRIDSFILLPSSKVFWGSALLLLFDFGRVLRWRLN